MTIKDIKITELKEYENNPRHNDGAVEAVAASIKEFGFKVPIVIDADNVIIAGHTRLKAAKKLGLETVPCIVANDLTPEQVKAFRLADNKTAEFAEWDLNALAKEIYEIKNLDMKIFGFMLDDIDIDEFSTDFELPDGDVPLKRTITLTLSPEQYEIAESVIAHNGDKIEHDFGNDNQKTNAFFEAIYAWAEKNNCIE